MDSPWELKLEVGSHLRRVHFFLVAASVVCVAVTFGYRDLRISAAEEELERLAAFADYAGALEANAGRIKRRLIGFRLVVDPSKAVLVGREGVEKRPAPILPDLEEAELEADGADGIRDCAEWGSIARSETADFDEVLGGASRTIRCRWLGENTLLYLEGPGPQPAATDLRVAIPSGVSLARPEQVENVGGQGVRDLALDDCAEWSDIKRTEFQDIAAAIKASGEQVDGTMPCRWIGEDSLLFAIKSPREEEDPKDVWIATPLATELRPFSELNTFGLRRIDGRALDQCAGSQDSSDYDDTALVALLDQRFEQGESILCKWIAPARLLAYPVEWGIKANQSVPERLREVVAKAYSAAFPNLWAIEEEIWQESEDFGEERPWDDKPLVYIESYLQTRLLALDKLDVFGFPLNRTLLFYGGTGFIVLIQTYFLLHFRQLTKIDCSLFPWVGLYEDRLSRTIFFLSVVMLPPVALWMFALQGLAPAAWAVFASAILSTLIAAGQAWDLRGRWTGG